MNESEPDRVVRCSPSRVAGPGQDAPGERAPRDHADPLVDALRDHLPLLFPVYEVVCGPAWRTNRVQPLRSAVYWALANCHANMLLAPMYRAFPARTTIVQRLHGLPMGVW